MATSRPFAYNTGATIEGTEQLGSLAIGIPSTGFTNSPKFYMGPDEDLGYVVAGSVSGGTQPSSVSGETASLQFWRTKVKSDEELINLARSISKFTQTFATVNDASNWLTNNGYWSSFTIPPSLITNNLLIHLDTSNSSSYSGSGSNLNDISGNGKNLTLGGGYSFSSNNSGIIYFDGSSGYARTNNTVNLASIDFTLGIWVKHTRMGTSPGQCPCPTASTLVSLSNILGIGDFWDMFNMGSNPTDFGFTSFGMDVGYNGHTTNVSNASGTLLNNWVYVTLVYYSSTDSNVYSQGGMYFNGIKQSNMGNIGYPSPLGANKNINLFRGNPHCGDCPTQGFFGGMHLYNTALSGSQVLQNYNATKTRFGL